MAELPQGRINKEKVLLEGNDAISVYNRGYYGIPGTDGVQLTGFEGLHLVELGRIEIFSFSHILSEEEIMQYFSELHPDFMGRYLVYKDLRNRGYIVNQGIGSSFFFRLYLRGHIPKRDSATYYITPLQEGKSINLDELDDLVKTANQSKKELVFGLVDASGDVSYLKVDQLYPIQLNNKEFSNFEKWNWQNVWDDYISSQK